jgi:hypothetical protein
VGFKFLSGHYIHDSHVSKRMRSTQISHIQNENLKSRFFLFVIILVLRYFSFSRVLGFDPSFEEFNKICLQGLIFPCEYAYVADRAANFAITLQKYHPSPSFASHATQSGILQTAFSRYIEMKYIVHFYQLCVVHMRTYWA